MMTDVTARYIGLRTYRYSPRTTRCSVGAGGAGVPRPSIVNCANDPSSVAAPAAISSPPATRCQPVSHQGTSPATTPGAITRKPALPAMAAFVCIGARPGISCMAAARWPAAPAHVAIVAAGEHATAGRPSGDRLAGRLLPDRHVLVALAGERLPPPPGPPLAQPHPRELGHQVKLGRPHIPEREVGVLAAAALHLDVVRAHRLRGGVVDIERPAGLADVAGQDILPGREPAQLRNVNFDDEAATGRQVGGDVAEAGHLRFLRGQVHDRVEDQVRERERPLGPRGREVADRHADLCAARLGAQPGDHGLGQVDATYRYAAAR